MSKLRVGEIEAVDGSIPSVKNHTIYVESVAEVEALPSPTTDQEAMVYGSAFRYSGTEWAPSKGLVTVGAFGAVGDGVTDDTVAINAAIAGAPVGGTVLLPGGQTFLVSQQANGKAVLCDRGDITIVIEGTLKFDAASTATTVLQVGDTGTFSRVLITGNGTIDGNGKGTQGVNGDTTGAITYLTIEKIKIINTTGTPSALFTGNGCSHVTFDGCVLDSNAEGILWSGDYIACINNRITNTTAQDAIEPAGFSNYWIVEGNFIDGTGQQGVDIFQGCDFGIVANNIVLNTTGASIDVSTQSTVPTHIIITGNYVQNSGGEGIRGGNRPNVIISDNIVKDSQSIGIRLAKNVFNNYVENSVGENILVSVDNSLISGNRIVGGANGSEGIAVVGTRDDITVQGNKVSGCSTGVSVTAAGCTNLLFSGNNIFDNTTPLSIVAGSLSDTLKLTGNLGVTLQSKGTVTISSGLDRQSVTSAEIDVFGVTDPSSVLLIPTNAESAGSDWYIRGDFTDVFRVQTNAAVGADATFQWIATSPYAV